MYSTCIAIIHTWSCVIIYRDRQKSKRSHIYKQHCPHMKLYNVLVLEDNFYLVIMGGILDLCSSCALDFMTWILARALWNIGLDCMIEYMRDIEVKYKCYCLHMMLASWVRYWAYVLDFMTWILARAYWNISLGYMIKYKRDTEVKYDCHCLRISHITRAMKVEVCMSPTAYKYTQ